MSKVYSNIRFFSQIIGRTAVCLAFALIIFTAAASAATYTVDTTSSDAALTACTAAANDCSLRGAIARANATPDNDTIDFALPAGINTIDTNGELTINNAGALTITNSTGASNLLISGGGDSRVFLVNSGANLTLNAVTVESGDARGGFGGGIQNKGTTTITNSVISGNSAFNGGGIDNFDDFSTLSLVNSTVSGNTATTTGPGGGGGGIVNSGTATITNSTISENRVEIYDGGGIFNDDRLTITNSTISGNTARVGGGIYNSAAGRLTLTGVTVAFNSAVGGDGGGIRSFRGTATLRNTIVANNAAATSSADFEGAIASTSSFNLIGSGTGMTGIANGNGGNQVGTSTNPIDPKLDPTLAFNGGGTPNHALLPDSTAIDRGNDTGTTDQRGFFRPIDLPNYANATGGNAADIGAFEAQTTPPALPRTVDTNTDNAALSACTAAPNDCSLRGAVSAANASAFPDSINFADGITNIALTGQITINNAGTLNINGPGANVLTIDGGAGTNRIFFVDGAEITIQGVTLSGGNGGGAAVFVRGAGLILESVVVKDNSGLGAFAFGAIAFQGTGGDIKGVRIQNSTISGNTDFTGCPAIYAEDGVSLNITNTTVSGNSTTATGFGAGAICVWGNSRAAFRSTTISGNAGGTGGGGGGGIYIQNNARVDLGNTIVAGNTSPNRGPDLYRFDGGGATFHSATGNVIGDNSGNPSAPNTDAFPTGSPNPNGDRVGTAGAVINPRLAPLADNGGTTPTRALLPGSGAIDAGRNSLATAFGPPTDQRGAGRIQDGDNDGTATVDSGAFELAGIFAVDTIDDNEALSACTPASNDCSLRGAIARANQTLDDDRIGFALPAGINTIALTDGGLRIDDAATAGALTITNQTGASNLLISGNNVSRVFFVQPGANLTLNAITVTKGNTGSNGGGIYNSGTTTLTNSAVSGNAGATGGGVYNDGGAATFSNSTVSGNVSTGDGGGIFNNSGGTISLLNSTVSGNRGQNGGGILSSGTLNLTSVTVAYNTAQPGIAGGVYNTGGTANLRNTIVAKNSAASQFDFSGAISQPSSFNLIGDGAGMTGIANGSGGNQIGINPKLDSTLAPNGGTTPNHALLPDSPAIDKGSHTGTDQRGLPRPADLAAYANAAGGNGADIGAFEVQTGMLASADLTVVKSHAGNFTQGDTGKTYSITVSNSGSKLTGGTVSVVDTLPSGLTAAAITGAGWTCALETLTCTRSDSLAVGASYSAITLTVNVANDAPASVTNRASVSGGGETNTGNNTANDPTVIAAAAAHTVSGRITNGGEGLSGVAVSVSGSAAARATTDAAGNYSFANLSSNGSYTITPALNGYTFVQPSITVTNPTADQTGQNFATSVVTFEGDVAARPTGDGAVDVLDIITVGNIIANLPNAAALAAGGEFQRADSAPRITKGDGSIDVQDLIQMGLLAAAREPLAPASGPVTVATPTSTFIEALTAESTESIMVIEDQNQTGSLNNVLEPNAPAAGSATLSAGNATASMGAAVVPAQLNSSNVGGVQFTITYDPAKLSIPSPAAITNRAANTSFTFNNSTPGRLGVVAVQSTAGDAFPASTLLFNINFTVTAGAPGGAVAIGFGNTPVPIRASDPSANSATITTTGGTVTILGPTAAEVTVSGRALTAAGRGIRNVLITLTDSAGGTRTARTTAFGKYRFGAVNAGETYVITARGKRYSFTQPSQVINVSEDQLKIDFIANP